VLRYNTHSCPLQPHPSTQQRAARRPLPPYLHPHTTDRYATQAKAEVAEARQAAEAASLREAQAWREVATDTATLRHEGLALVSALRRVVGLTLSATASLRQAAATLPGGGGAGQSRYAKTLSAVSMAKSSWRWLDGVGVGRERGVQSCGDVNNLYQAVLRDMRDSS